MVVAVVPVLMVKMRGDEIVGVIVVRDALVAAVGVMAMFGWVILARVRSAGVGPIIRDRQRVFVDVIVVHPVEMPAVKIVYVVVVADGRVAAVCAMRMVVFGVSVVFHARITLQACRSVNGSIAKPGNPRFGAGNRSQANCRHRS